MKDECYITNIIGQYYIEKNGVGGWSVWKRDGKVFENSKQAREFIDQNLSSYSFLAIEF